VSNDPRTRVRVPQSARAGEAVTVRTLISHPMESGQRRDAAGALVPRAIIHRFTAELNGRLIVDVALDPAISANPQFEFEAIVDRTGEFLFTWYDDDGSVHVERAPITVV
jgi:sulfur-oxidizing protein SoxZ